MNVPAFSHIPAPFCSPDVCCQLVLVNETGLDWSTFLSVVCLFFVCPVTREPSWSFGSQQHHRSGAAAHQELSARECEATEGGGEIVGTRKRHRLQRLRSTGPSRPGQSE